MLTRCSNPRQASFKDYGGRGTTVDPRWRHGDYKRTGFECFLFDMGPRPEGKTLDRVNNDWPYVWWNCRWSTWSEQMRNRRAHKRPAATGEGNPQAKLTWTSVPEIRALKGRMSRAEIARRFGVSASAIDFVLHGRTWREPLTIDQGA
jgi:hypothetical protein